LVFYTVFWNGSDHTRINFTEDLLPANKYGRFWSAFGKYLYMKYLVVYNGVKHVLTVHMSNMASVFFLNIKIKHGGCLIRGRSCLPREHLAFKSFGFERIWWRYSRNTSCALNLIRYSRACGSYQDFLDKRVAANKKATEPKVPLS
jgi:hypothetical protein